MRVAALVSGGKDSVLAAQVVADWGWQITEFLTLLPTDEAPMMYQRPNCAWVRLQAAAVGVPWRSEPVADLEDEEPALARLLGGVRADAVVTGALASEYQRVRFERAAAQAKLRSFMPLWHHAPRQHLLDVIRSGLRARVVHVAAEGLDRTWLGRELDEAAAAHLNQLADQTGLNPAGEGGEFETFVTDAPLMRQKIVVDEARTEWRRDSGTWTIERAHLAPK